MSDMKQKIEQVKAWRAATSAWPGLRLSPEEVSRRRAERALVISRSGSSMNSIAVAICRGNITSGMYKRLSEASQDTSHPIAME